MWQKITDLNYWFSQPLVILINGDKLLAGFFLTLTVLGIVLWIVVGFVSHATDQKLIKRFWHLTFTIGLLGLLWAAFRYENVPIFSLRVWALLVALIGGIWLLFIIKYLIFDFRSEKNEFDKQSVKNKYLPGSAR